MKKEKSIKKTKVDERDLYQKAVKAYEKLCKQLGGAPILPSETASEVGRKYVHLKNSYQDIAKYEIKTNKIIEGA